MNKYTIHIKGNIPTVVAERLTYSRLYQDFSYSQGFINFTGTEKQLDGLLEYLNKKGDGYFKVIGVHDDEIEKFYQEMFPEAYEKFKQSIL
jgi:hypothetical protein